MKTHITARPSCRRDAEAKSSFRHAGVIRNERICFPRSIRPSLESIQLEIPNKPRSKERKKLTVATKQSKREAIAFGLALLFVVGTGSGFAWSIAALMRLLSQALPVLMRSQGALG